MTKYLLLLAAIPLSAGTWQWVDDGTDDAWTVGESAGAIGSVGVYFEYTRDFEVLTSGEFDINTLAAVSWSGTTCNPMSYCQDLMSSSFEADGIAGSQSFDCVPDPGSLAPGSCYFDGSYGGSADVLGFLEPGIYTVVSYGFAQAQATGYAEVQLLVTTTITDPPVPTPEPNYGWALTVLIVAAFWFGDRWEKRRNR